MTGDVGFIADVDCLLAGLVEKGPQTFGALLTLLPGVDPALVRARLEQIPEPVRTRVHWERATTTAEPCEPLLPVPHPLDFDWRFAERTRGDLSRELAESGAHAVLLGAPSVWLEFHRQPRAGSQVTLIDRTSLAVQIETGANLRHLIVDLLADPLPNHLPPADVVLADPPWYPEATAQFVWAAAQVARLGSRFLLSVAPLGTRPGILEERAALERYAEQWGYTLREKRAASLVYAMPPFERNVFRSLGLAEYVPFDWRRGDLFVFERTRIEVGTRPPCDDVLDDAWTERAIGGVRLRFRLSQGAGLDPRLEELVAGGVLPTVSRRDPRRRNVRLWTSGNRVFGCRAPALLLRVLDDPDLAFVAEDVPPQWLRDARDAVKTVVQREQGEYVCSEHA